ncbi:hypothetical protein E4U17_006554 [Claviceps sp. LM77 group G4]|nr:hypothetical protein E4U17_006554 [Claviceps sp. LM77 group G4]KAG6068154.1 hypothetical protein E4U33_005117 [Claviceps sp. LM78 group G4]
MSNSLYELPVQPTGYRLARRYTASNFVLHLANFSSISVAPSAHGFVQLGDVVITKAILVSNAPIRVPRCCTFVSKFWTLESKFSILSSKAPMQLSPPNMDANTNSGTQLGLRQPDFATVAENSRVFAEQMDSL